MSDYDDDEGSAEKRPERAPKAPFRDRVRFVPLATYKRLQTLLDAVEARMADEKARHRAAYAEAMATVSQVAAERDALRIELERARMTPQTKADTEAAYARGLAAASRRYGRYFLGEVLPEHEMSARKLSQIARDLAKADPGHDPHADDTTTTPNKENDQ
ncbi:hypothetical protein [Microbispora sp. NPDC049633]|uniref:hypothetical protein n=1 Tax=Microbispora sp. NPDC049633 TaxID=3154355 RepID=UPI00343F1CDC